MIHVCYGLNDKKGTYSKYTGVSMLSMFENTKEKVTVHIFHDNTLTPENKNYFIQVADTYNQTVKFYNLDELCPEKIQYLREKIPAYVDSRFTVGAFYRLMIKKSFFDENFSKIIYLDSDTVVNLDIAELWNYDLSDYPLASVSEITATRNYMRKNKYLLSTGKVEVDDYFCSGIVMLNLDKLSENLFDEGINWLAENQECDCPDQDILNYFFSKNYLKLPEKFNSFVNVCKVIEQNIIYNKIYHYAGRGCLGMAPDEHNKLFLKYFAKTPWFNLNIFEKLYNAAQKMRNDRKNFGYKILNLMNGKQRAFFTFAPLAALVKNYFNLTKNDEFIIVKESESLEPLAKALRKSKNKKVFFIMVDNYETVKNFLIQSGFKEFENFVNATMFVPNYEQQDFSFLLVEEL